VLLHRWQIENYEAVLPLQGRKGCANRVEGIGGKLGLAIPGATVEQLTFMIIGALIILVLILEPQGLAQLWRTVKQKLRVWPFPY